MQRNKERHPHDAYFTPADTVQEFLSVQDVLEPGCTVWEPACGAGNISKELIMKGFDVYSTDLNNFGYGITNVNFLEATKKVDAIITNPPFSIAEQFITHALSQADTVVMFLRLSFLEGQNRARGLWKQHPPHKVYICGRRPTLVRADYKGEKISGFVAYAWFVWKKGCYDSKLEWIIDTGVTNKQFRLF